MKPPLGWKPRDESAKPSHTNPAERKRGGRPRRVLHLVEVQRLQAEGLSLRQIARRLHAGYGTVHRLTRGQQGDPELIQNPATSVLETERPNSEAD